jgi:hypothetical protein
VDAGHGGADGEDDDTIESPSRAEREAAGEYLFSMVLHLFVFYLEWFRAAASFALRTHTSTLTHTHTHFTHTHFTQPWLKKKQYRQSRTATRSWTTLRRLLWTRRRRA